MGLMVGEINTAGEEQYSQHTIDPPFLGGSLFEWVASLDNTDGFLVELLPQANKPDRYTWLNETGLSAFEPPDFEISNSWQQIKPGLISALEYYAQL